MAQDDSILAWYPLATADGLPEVMLETDTRLSCKHVDDKTNSVFGNSGQCMLYKYSNTLAYKPVCEKRENDFIDLAGSLTFPVICKIGCVRDDKWIQRGALLEFGKPFDVDKTNPASRLSIARLMVLLVTSLHQKGIIHGDIKPDNFMWTADEKALRIINFGSSRMVNGSDLDDWEYQGLTPEYISPTRSRNGQPPTAFDDYYALAVSIWAVFSGQWPYNGLFNTNDGDAPDLGTITDDELFCSVVDILERGGLNLDQATTLARKDSLPVKRTLSFPLSIFGECPDVLDDSKPLSRIPKFCQHCFDAIMSSTEELGWKGTVYPEFCHLSKAEQVATGETPGVRWLDEHSEVSESPMELDVPSLSQQRSPRNKSGWPARRKSHSPPRLDLKVSNHRAGASSRCVPTGGDYLTARPLDITAIGAWVASLPNSATPGLEEDSNVQRSMSHWSVSTDEQGSEPETGSDSGCSDSSQLKTPMPATARFSPPSSISQRSEDLVGIGQHHCESDVTPHTTVSVTYLTYACKPLL